MNVLIFAGTTEGRLLAQALAELEGVDATLCVATDYGKAVLEHLPARFTVLAARLSVEEMKALMAGGGFALAVDATHPYAVQVTDNIRAAASGAGLPLLRLLREEGAAGEDGCRYAESAAQVVEYLSTVEGNILLTTGSKELEPYTALPDYTRRVYPRVLPMVDAIEKCAALGFLSGHIIAMQGPFSEELNRAMLRQFDIKFLVTKDSGKAGGFAEKVNAARDVGVELLVIGRPAEEEGHSLAGVLEEIKGRMGDLP